MPSALAVFAHPDDIEFVAAGTLLLLKERDWEIHYMNLCNGHGGSVQMDAKQTVAKRFEEAREAARILGAKFYPPISNDLELVYDVSLLRKVAAVVRFCRADVVLTHSPSDYMEDHMTTQRLAVTAAFSRCIPNFVTDPPSEAFYKDVTVYHAMPHGMRDPLRKRIRAGAYVDTTSVHDTKRKALTAHEGQKHWLDVSQGMDSYLVSMDRASQEVGRMSGRFQFAEGWRRHLHHGFSAREIDPLRDALGEKYLVDEIYENKL
jgi:LmbE family N-acetylglucosaminyl deacetylase